MIPVAKKPKIYIKLGDKVDNTIIQSKKLMLHYIKVIFVAFIQCKLQLLHSTMEITTQKLKVIQLYRQLGMVDRDMSVPMSKGMSYGINVLRCVPTM